CQRTACSVPSEQAFHKRMKRIHRGGSVMSVKNVFACIERVIPPEYEEEALNVGIQENPANEQEAFAIPKKVWKPARTLKIRFLDGMPAIQEKVKQYALQWTEYANIRLEFTDDEWSEIRISFQQPGSWSAIGTDARVLWVFPKEEPTMNFGWLKEETPDEEY